MAEETRIIRVKVEGYDQARRELEELKRLRDELSQPIRAQATAAGGGSIISAATGMPLSAAGAGAGSLAGGSFVPRANGGLAGGELAAASEQVVAQLANEVRSSMAGAAQRFSQGQPIGGGLSTSRPMASGATGLPAIPAQPVVFAAGGQGFQEIQAAAASLLAEGISNASSEQIRQRAGQLRAQAQTASLMPTGTGGAAEVLPGNVTAMRGRGGGGGGRGGGGRRGGGDGGVGDGPTDMAPEWWLGGGGTEAEWAQFDVFNSRKRVAQARAAMAGQTGRQKGPLDEAVMGSFQPAMLGLTFQFGVMPIQKALDPAIQAAEQFGAPDPARMASAQRLQQQRIRLGQQAAGAQGGWDDMAANVMGWAADRGLGGPLQNVTNSAQGVGDIATAWSPAVLTAYLGKRLLSGIGGPALAGGRAALGAAQAGMGAMGAAAGGGLLGALGIGAGLAGVGAGGVALAEAGVGAGARTMGMPADWQAAIGISLRQALGNMGPLGQAGAAALNVAGVPAVGQQAPVAPSGTFTGASLGMQPAGAVGQPGGFIGPPSPIQAIMARQQAEAARAALPGGQAIMAAEQELAQREQTTALITGARVRMGISDEATALGRRRFANEQLIASRRFDENVQWAYEDLGTAHTRRVRDIQLGTARGREDLNRSVGRSAREIAIGAGESHEDVDIGYRRGLQDIMLGQIGGIGGAILRAGIARRRGHQDVDRGAGRARGRLGRSALDAGADLDTGEGRAIADAERAKKDAEADLDRDFGPKGRIRGRFEEDQKRAAQQEAEDAELQKRLRQLALDEIELRAKLNTDFGALAANQVQIYKDFNEALKAAGNKAANDLAKIFEGWNS